ncbi:hypothetical protein [Paracoccus aerodenitrificans]|uniref:hypothetical protein n=1 Tax=Paracoccus aerodenitrificans TaxID=3017781 RepID=UPI0022F0326A|nr:hypothetical protein [Paracoccus aerodenitrificans]WBU64539.1 hypothetical protein PAE61_03575 [Paracoccus aerodenitrificans]
MQFRPKPAEMRPILLAVSAMFAVFFGTAATADRPFGQMIMQDGSVCSVTLKDRIAFPGLPETEGMLEGEMVTPDDLRLKQTAYLSIHGWNAAYRLIGNEAAMNGLCQSMMAGAERARQERQGR